jgi:four helix bundle protein
MNVKKFEDIIAWQKGGELTMEIYKTFKNCRDFNFKDQIQRAVVSIMNNIAEGFERKSNKEFARFLYIAKGSCGEVRSMLYIAFRLNYITEEEFKRFYKLSVEISKVTAGLIKSLK